MRTRFCAIGCGLSFLVACGGSDGSAVPTMPSTPGRTTETITVAGTILRPDGAMLYPAGTPIPTIVVAFSGLVEARVSFTPVPGCDFRFSLTRSDASGVAVISTGGPGPELAFAGVVLPDTYRLGLVARSGGVSLCGELPAAGVPMPHTIVVTHP